MPSEAALEIAFKLSVISTLPGILAMFIVMGIVVIKHF